MAAYAALLSLARSLGQVLDLQHECIHPLHKEKFVDLNEKVDFVVTFLEEYDSDKYGAGKLDNGFKKATYEAQDCLDSYLSAVLSATCLDQDLIDTALERINLIWQVSMEIMKNSTCTAAHTAQDDIPPALPFSASPVDQYSPTVTKLPVEVGFDDDFNTIKERLFQDSDKLLIIPIVGMGGIGKTTLARKVYEDSLLARDFDIYAWITMSAEYHRRKILLEILQSVERPDEEEELFKKSEELFDKTDAELEKLAYQSLIGRRYLVVIDDIWSSKAWDDFRMIFSDDGSGSRILLTTRILDVAEYVGSSSNPLHQMNFLSEDDSWKLLQEKTFRQESCPLQLVEIGKKIARNCGGLPLTIVVVAGILLSSGNITSQEFWENISENISSGEPTIDSQCSKVLSLSYDKLPLRLKPCFLYTAAFPEDLRISAPRLIKLWVAEGLVRSNDTSKCVEEVGERYLEDLVNRSLILVNEKGLDGKLETIGIHDLLREICVSKAEEDGFLHRLSSKEDTPNEVVDDDQSRRISIHYTKAFQEWSIKEDSRVRSLLLFSEKDMESRLSLNCRSLNVLDAPVVTWPNFSEVISSFVNLRYLSFALNDISCPHGFPASISKLANLQTIIVHITYIFQCFEVPNEIWEMPKLRHLIMNVPFCLANPSNVQGSGLETLDEVKNFRFTEEAVKTFVNLKKLLVVFAMFYDNWDGFILDNLFRLQNLEELRVCVHNLNKRSGIWNHDFPVSLKMLYLWGVPLPWKSMSIIGSLPNLQVLEMMSIDVNEASEWTTIEGEFLQLKLFRSSLDYLEKWEAEKEHFPSLESLILCGAWINEIPSGIGEIDSLQLIELVNCYPSLVVSAELIEKQQYENGNYTFQLRVINKI